MLLLIIKTIFILIHIAIGVYDFSFYRIPNLLLAILLVLYGIFAPFYIGLEGLLTAIAVFVVVLGISFILFATKFIGGGDAKYLAVASLWAGFPGVLQLFLITALVGGVMAIIYLILRDHVARLSDLTWKLLQKAEKYFPLLQYIWIGSGKGPEKGKRQAVSSRMIPYGIAIAVGAITTMLFHPVTH